MNEQTQEKPPEDNHRARTARQAPVSPIWLVPIVALLIGAWLAYQHYASRGPLITLTTQNAEGIEAGKTLIKTRSVDIGNVEKLSLSDDLTQVIIQARMKPEAEPLLVKDSSFWVVRPRIGRDGVSGLGTVLSGAYIQLEPGQDHEEARHFVVSDQPPVAPPGAKGLHLNLITQAANSLSVGDPVTFQGLSVGRIEEANFDVTSREMHHQVFIRSPYDELVTTNTRFWTSTGIDLSLGSEGIQFQMASLKTLIDGGITFGVPDGMPPGEPASQHSTFELFGDATEAQEGTYDRYLKYVLLFEDSVRGLSRGAPVEFRGIRVGTVESVPWQFTAPQPQGRDHLAIPVLIHIEPERLEGDDPIDLSEWKTRFDDLFENGLRASLKNGNLLTGALFVDVTFDEQRADSYVAETFSGVSVFPTTSGGLAQIQGQVTALLDKLNNLEVEPILTNLDRNLATSEEMLNQINQLTAELRGLLGDEDTRKLPATLNSTLVDLQATLKGISPQSNAYQELTTTLHEVRRLMRDLQPAARKISDDPRSLIFEGPRASDPVPRAPNQRRQP
ncbi:intermembrane transport protein PqiB [Halomonas halocynthiae]|uniref:intermembrane transport protein PqiB n=1 Tax=Halomonas halocynthiae TaxID=176290 RepID=UPI00041F3D65|nr:intermembrane transport protein PqiB [Halomonas halocynthiae]